ncbi:hypothetical protein [Marinobacter bohaiensis]|uniref:hypothetical protein n=1 Tax=Marinobacter bohaiensis TaxID=2201898 RepID=UPI000DAC1B1D|nr:hypothetical protein [Marinobacter bohaiensis]
MSRSREPRSHPYRTCFSQTLDNEPDVQHGLPLQPDTERTLTIASVAPDWIAFGDHLGIRLAQSTRAFIWLRGAEGSGKTRFVQEQVARWPFPSLWLDLRQEAEIMASGVPALKPDGPAPALILDDMSPADLDLLIADPAHPAGPIVLGHQGPILIVSRNAGEGLVPSLKARTGRELEIHAMPPSDVAQRLSILRAHQPEIERYWQVEIQPDAMLRAARGGFPDVPETPGRALRWLHAAAARAALEAREGSPECRATYARLEDLNRALLGARGSADVSDAVTEQIRQVEIEQAAYDVDWHERGLDGRRQRIEERHVAREIHLASTAGAKIAE